MNNPGNGSATTPSEELLLLHVAMFALGGLVASAGALWLTGSRWLVAHKILVAADQTPLIAIPGAAGAGLDLPRICIAAAAVLAAVVITISWARRQLRARPEREAA